MFMDRSGTSGDLVKMEVEAASVSNMAGRCIEKRYLSVNMALLPWL